jgi:alcohol dehydrogenase class IV
MARDSVRHFECPTRVLLGWGASDQENNRLADLGKRRAVVVGGPGVSGTGIVETVSARIRSAGIEVATYTGVQPSPTVSNVETGVVGLGGRSVRLTLEFSPVPRHPPPPHWVSS